MKRLCECGNVARKRRKYCDTCAYLKRDPVTTWCYVAFRHARDRAAKKNIPFDLSKDYLRQLALDRCPALGILLDYSLGKGCVKYNSPTVDRIVPELGYVPGNVIVVSSRANSVHSDATADELKRVAEFYAQVEQHYLDLVTYLSSNECL